MTTTDAARKPPFHLRGNHAPVPDEVTVTELRVTGRLPAELQGRYLRNGPNPITGESAHWFLGDGMIHGIELRDGVASWYRNRWVRTPYFERPTMPVVDLENLDFDITRSKANTHVIRHAGRILCLEEGHVPWEITPELDTVGPVDFDGQLTGSFTAHPKRCPVTGELLAFGYGLMPPYLTYHRISAEGVLVQSEVIDVPAATMQHDFNVTRDHVVFMDLPVLFDLDLAMRGGMPFVWSDTHGARLGVMSRTGASADVRWYEIDPCYVFHPLNAYDDEAGRIVIDVARYPQLWRQGGTFADVSSLWRWVIDPATGTVTETQLDDRPGEFPRVADARVGLDHRFGYLVSQLGRDERDSLVKYDLAHGGAASAHTFGPGRTPGEAVFVPAEGAAAEDDGYLMTYVYDAAEDRSDFVVLDARDLTADPIAVVELPRRVPFGFHGSWIPDA